MPAPRSESSAQIAERTAWRAFSVTLLIALPMAILGFLYLGDFFDAYEGLAVAHRPVPGSDGVDDTMQRFVLDREDGTWVEVLLPVEAFSGRELPLSPYGAPPRVAPDDAVQVSKSRFTLHSRVGGVPWATASGLDLVLPAFFLVMVGIGRNLFTTGSAFQVVPGGSPGMPVPLQTPHGQIAKQPGAMGRERPKKGPPPPRPRGKKGKHRRRR